jgi:hypothetical protein
VQVNCRTADGTARAPGDYAAVNRTISFQPGTTVRTFSVPIVDDALAEADERAVLSLSDARNATVDAARSRATLTIVDNDRTTTAALYLPVTFNRGIPFAPPCSASNRYCEENDTHQTAYGPVGPGQPYSAYPDDRDDFYFFVLSAPRTVRVKLHRYPAKGDLILYRRTGSGGREPVANWGKGGSEMEIPAMRLGAGTYYVLVYTVEGETSKALYTLVVWY